MATDYSVTANPNPVNEGSGAINFTITRSGSLPAETLFASTVQNQGFTNSGDYATNINNLQVAFALGQTSVTVPLTIFNDTVSEPDEIFRFIVQRTADPNVNNNLAATNFTIHDDDVSTSYSITPNPATVSEGAGALTFTVTRSG